MSSLRSLPAQSTSVRRPVAPEARQHVRRSTACDRDDAALQCVAEVARRADFFAQPILSPLSYNLTTFPPLLLISGTRDYFYSDSPALGERACRAGVGVESLNAYGAFHDFVEYSEGCGGGEPLLEAIEAFGRIRIFVQDLRGPADRPSDDL